MDRDPAGVPAGDRDLAGVQPGPDLHAERRGPRRSSPRHSGPPGPRCRTGPGSRRRSSRSRGPGTGPARTRSASLWSSSTRRHALSPMPRQRRGRIDDVGEQDRRQGPLVLLVGGDPEQPRAGELDGVEHGYRRPPRRRDPAGSRRRRRPRCRAPCRRPSGHGDAHRSRSRDGGSRTTACRRRA